MNDQNVSIGGFELVKDGVCLVCTQSVDTTQQLTEARAEVARLRSGINEIREYVGSIGNEPRGIEIAAIESKLKDLVSERGNDGNR